MARQSISPKYKLSIGEAKYHLRVNGSKLRCGKCNRELEPGDIIHDIGSHYYDHPYHNCICASCAEPLLALLALGK